MALYGQPNQWQCGPFALKHALLMQGVRAHEDTLARIAGSSEQDGTDENQLATAAAHHGAHLMITRRRSARAARATLRHWLREQPVLLCLDQWDHWVTAAGCDEERVVLLDSHFDTVLRIEPWDAVLRRTAYRQPWPVPFGAWTWYDLHAVRVRQQQDLRLRLSPAGAERLIAAGQITAWDDRVRALKPLMNPGVPTRLAEALAAVRDDMAEEVQPEVDAYVAVAEAFDLRARALRPERVREVLFAVQAQRTNVLPLHAARRASTSA